MSDGMSYGPKRLRYGTYKSGDSDSAEIAVRVTAADYNGEGFDGRPFSSIPLWLINAMADGKVVCHTRGSTDYAQWDVTTKDGVKNATPDDWIIRRENGDLSVVDGQDAFVLINLRPPSQGDSERENR